MANILDYMDWRGDLTFARSAFNEVDNLILSQLAYVDLYGIVTDKLIEGQGISIEEAARLFFETHDEKKILSQVSMTKSAILVLKKMAETVRYRDARLFGYINDISEEEQCQFSVLSILLSDGSVYVAFSGTDASLVGWREDFNMSYLMMTPGHRKALDYIDEMQYQPYAGLRLGGHSKGGNFAVFAALACRDEVQSRIIAIYNNDGPGFAKPVVESNSYQKILPKVCSIVPESSLVGVLLEHQEKYIVVRSENEGLDQHDAMSWKVLGTHFEQAEQINEKSIMLDETLEEWLSQFSNAERQRMVDGIFSVLDAADIKTVDDFYGMKWKQLQEVIRATKGLTGDTARLLQSAFRRLLKSGRETVRRFLQQERQARRDR